MRAAIDWFFQPNIFSYFIMLLYAANVVNFAVRRNVGMACYWFSALCITATVTFLLKSK